MAKGFYRKLAWNNLRRSKDVCLPYMIATAIISGVFFLTVGLAHSDKLANVPAGETTQGMFAMAIWLFAIFSAGFMSYINNFLVKRRKKEFGLYGVLGLSKNHVGRVLLWENGMTIGIGVLAGMAFSLVFGRLLFLLLLKLIRAAPDSTFSIAPQAYVITGVLFLFIYVATSVYNLVQIRLSNPIELLHSEKEGDKPDGKSLVPAAVIGFALLGAAYYYAWTIKVSTAALGLFFPLALLVIIATSLLFTSGSIVVLRMLRANKRVYYKLKNFVSISGMFHRMRQNAAGLAAICILSTMLVVTVSTTLALYLGQESILRETYSGYDLSVALDRSVWKDKSDAEQAAAVEQLAKQLDGQIETLGRRYGVEAEALNLPAQRKPNAELEGNEIDWTYDKVQYFEHCAYANGRFVVKLNAGQTEGLAFSEAFERACASLAGVVSGTRSIYASRQQGYAVYGGLLFLGAFFGILFLAVTVLLIYFKQVTEGHEDKERFEILQKVGMDEAQVKSTINRQILWVFFLPLGMTFLHMVFASRIIARMLQCFLIYDWTLTLRCAAGVCAVFALLYLIVYRATAKTYFKIVKW